MKNSIIKIGVLDIQGSVEEHMEALRRLKKVYKIHPQSVPKKTSKSVYFPSGKPKSMMVPDFGDTIEPVLVKTVEQLRQVRGLIIPGGESTAIGKLLRRFGLRDEIISLAKSGELAVWGTCAGAILLARKIAGEQQADSLALMDMVIERNAYGRQLDSFETNVKFDVSCFGESKKATSQRACLKLKSIIKIPAIFIRAPKVVSAGKGVKILAKYDGGIVAVRQKNLLATNFHPELTESLDVHEYFVKMCGN